MYLRHSYVRGTKRLNPNFAIGVSTTGRAHVSLYLLNENYSFAAFGLKWLNKLNFDLCVI